MGRKAAPTISVAEFAADWGVKPRTAQLWIADGMPYRDQDGERRIVRSDANKWRLEREREKAREEEGISEATERALKTKAERELKELELAERRRQVVPVADYEERLSAFVGGFAAVASGQLARFERDIVAATDPPAARRVTDAMHAALMQGARAYADELEGEAAGAADAPAA